MRRAAGRAIHHCSLIYNILKVDGKSAVHYRVLFVDVCSGHFWTMGDWIQVPEHPVQGHINLSGIYTRMWP